jgi:hypothetical protein
MGRAGPEQATKRKRPAPIAIAAGRLEFILAAIRSSFFFAAAMARNIMRSLLGAL